MSEEIKMNVLLNTNPPNFTSITNFIWGEKHNIDSDGDFDHQNKRWVYLYAKSRERKNEKFTVNQISDSPLIYQVSSQNEVITSKVAGFLAREANGNILDKSEQ